MVTWMPSSSEEESSESDFEEDNNVEVVLPKGAHLAKCSYRDRVCGSAGHHSPSLNISQVVSQVVAELTAEEGGGYEC